MNRESKTKIYDDRTFFGAYLDATDEKKIIVDALVETIVQTRTNDILDLGCFDGTLIKAVAAKVLHAGKKINKIVGVEPSPDPLHTFKKSIENSDLSVKFEFINETMETFLGSTQECFDWTIACHSLYWLQTPAETISQIAASAKNGAIVIRDSGVLHQIEKKYRPLMINNTKLFFSSDEITDHLQKLAIPYSVNILPAHIRVPSLEQRNELKAMTGFLLDLTFDQIRDELLEDFYHDLGVKDGHIQFNNALIRFGETS